VLAAIVNLNHPAHFVQWGFFPMSVPNLVAIIVMLVLFGVVIVAPFPGHRRGRGGRS
jgi:hypothetical protein